MKILIRACFSLFFCCFFISNIQAQNPAAGSNNVSQHPGSNNSGKWSFGLGTGISFSLKNDQYNLFRGNGMSAKMFGRYYFGKIGLSASTGFFTGNINNNALNKFIIERNFPQEDLKVTKGNPLNGFFLFGPSIRFGNKLYVNADLQGGLFLNNPGTVDIMLKEENHTLYRFDGSEKNFFPGFSGSISFNYSVSPSTDIFINADYVQSKISYNLIDLANRISVATKMNRDLKLMNAGIGIIKNFHCNNRNKRESRNEYSNPLYSGKGNQQNPLYESKGINKTNPLYEDKGLQGTNPLYEKNGLNGTNPMHESKRKKKPENVSYPEKVSIQIGADGFITGKLQAQDYNSSRSNKCSGIVLIGIDGIVTGKLEAQDYNSSRSNKCSGIIKVDENGNVTGLLSAQDYNSSRSNKILIREGKDGTVTGKLVAADYKTSAPNENILQIGEYGILTGKLQAQDYNSSRSNKCSGLVQIGEDGMLSGKLEAQDYNSTRSNKSYGIIRIGEDGTVTGLLAAQDYNSTRSNKCSGIVLIGKDGTVAGLVEAQDYNSSRSNK